MNERFERIFSLTGNLYTESAPLIISAGALLKDTETGKIFAQLKFKSISPEPIKAIKAKIVPMDTVGKPIGDEVFFDYLDLNEKRDAEFGQKKAIPMPNPATRSFTAEVTEVVFTNNSVWSASGNSWNPLDALVPLEQALGDHELVKQYRLQFGQKAAFQPQRTKDIWFCTCGAVNHDDTKKCHVCGYDENTLFSCDYNGLKAAVAQRIEQETAANIEHAKKRNKVLVLVASALAICIVSALIITKIIIPNSQYHRAAALFDEGRYSEAIDAFVELNGYRDSKEQITRCENAIKDEKYTAALELFNAGKYDEAISAFRSLNGYKDSGVQISKCETAAKDQHYNEAIDLYNAGNYELAYPALIALDGYKDSAEKANEIRTEYEMIQLKKADVGDYVIFGTYEQDNNTSNGKEPIEWLVLAKDKDKILLISRYALDYQQFNSSNEKVTWETCSLRKWLNSTFVSSAFNNNEQRVILNTTVTADESPYQGTTLDQGNDTIDRTFLLSRTELSKYFRSGDYTCVGTPYCFAKGAYRGDDNTCSRWLRTMSNSYYAADEVGWTQVYKSDVTDKNCIQPVMWVAIG